MPPSSRLDDTISSDQQADAQAASRCDPPLGFLALLAAAAAVYVVMLVQAATPMGPGDQVVGEAFALFYSFAALWGLLVALLLAGGIAGTMPRWSALAALFLVPLAGAAVFVSLDMVCNHRPWAITVPLLLPLLLGLYALWARWPRLQRALPAHPTSAAVWAVTFVVSGIALLAAGFVD